MPNYQKHIVYLSDEQREELFTNGTITVNGQTITYSDNDMYVTPQETPYVKPATGIPASDLAEGAIPEVPVQDVQVNGASILQNGVANVPVAGPYTSGVVKVHSNGTRGLSMTSDGFLASTNASTAQIKTGTDAYRPITPNHINDATFYGLAKAAGDATQSQSSNEVGTYTPEAKSAICSMIGAANADELNDKANRDGYYSEMTVGNAEQLVSSKFVEDQEPYTLRASGGSADIGNRENLTAIVGGTVAWNQAVRDEASENSTDFAPIVTVTDAVEDAAGVKVKIEPVQDLHGYDHPWPAGGGANKFNPSTWIQLGTNTNFYSVSGDDITVNASDESGIASRLLQLDAESTYSWRVFGNITTARIFGSNSSTVASGNTGSFTVPADGNVAIKFTADSYPSTGRFVLVKGSIVPTDFAPYSNICPITGWDGVKVTRTGRNVFGGLALAQKIQEKIPSAVLDTEAKTITFGSNNVKLFEAFFGNKNYTFVMRVANTYIGHASVNLGVMYASGVIINLVKDRTSDQKQTIVYTTNRANDYPVLFSVVQQLGTTTLWYEESGIFEGVVTAEDFEPYNGNIYPVDWADEAGTVYGGELTVNEDGTGQVVVDRAKINLGAFDFTTQSTPESHIFRAPYQNVIPDILPHPNGNMDYGDLCEEYVYKNWTPIGSEDNGCFSISPWSTNKFVVIDHRFTDVVSFQNAVRDVALVYYLATPITYTLTASQVQTILGTNNVWSDAGQLALTYKGTNEYLTMTDGRKYLTRINGVDSMVLGAGQAVTAVKGRDNVFDLTQMFGAADVADYVYGQGTGYFRKWFPNSWYAYNPGELKSVEGLRSHDTVGFNLWDEEWEVGAYSVNAQKVTQSDRIRCKNPVNVIPGASIYVTCISPLTDFFCVFTDENGNNVGTGISDFRINCVITVPNDSTKLVFYLTAAYGTTYKHDLCISLVNNGSRNGEYEPYEKHSYPLDSSLTLRGIQKAGANGIYWDGDRYLPDGTVERRYGVVDLGSLNWTHRSEIKAGIFATSDIVDYRHIITVKAVCDKYQYIGGVGGIRDIESYNKAIAIYWGIDASVVYIADSDFSDAAAFKAAMSGVMLVYELATPTSETAEPYKELQQVDDWGTEEFVTTGLVPVGHITQYPANLRDKLQHLPDLASSNGIYIVKQTDSEMELMRLPDMPTANGNYRLKLNVASGSPTFSWEAVT